MMQETVIHCGAHKHLVGILTEPATEALSPDAPIAVILNAGIVHRVGPYRLHVELARALAEVGFRACRFDLSGLGDSAPRRELSDPQERAILDGKEVFDQLQSRTGVDRFVVIGLCSGSFHAHQLSLRDPRVTGAVFLDGIAFATRSHRLRSLRRKFSYRFLRNAIKRRLCNLMPG